MATPRTSELYRFGPFRLDVPERQLLRDGRPVELRAKVFDTLVVLVRRAGRLVTRDELIAAVWPDAIVEEGNLSHNVSALRKALGGDENDLYVETVPRSGYRFVHPLEDGAQPTRVETSSLALARRAHEQGAWSAAHDAFLAAREEAPLSARDRELLAEAARWSGRFDEVVPLLEDAAQAWLAEGEPLRAADVSLELAGVLLDRRRVALAKSYVRQAERRLPARKDATGPELRAHSRVQRLRARLAWCDADWEGALEHARGSLELARAAEDPDAEALAASDVAHTLLALGRFDEVRAMLDETGACVASGRLGPYASGMALCGLIIAWSALGRPDRALEWSLSNERWADASGTAYFTGLCRVHRGELDLLRGELARAEQELVRAADELARADSGLAGNALRELGTVRLRRGDLEGAEAAFTKALQFGTDPQPGFALLRAARGETIQARRDLERFLSSEGGGELNLLQRQNRVAALAASARLALATGAHESARASLATLEEIAASTGSAAHRALVDAVRGELALSLGETREALTRLGASLRAWNALGAPHESACAREQMAEALLADGDRVRARLELEGAAAAFEKIGADYDASRARRRIEAAGSAAASTKQPVRVRGHVARASELKKVLGAEAWNDLLAWFERTLQRCWSEHGGRTIELGEGAYVVEFDDREHAQTCVRFVRESLRRHRELQGFAPELVVQWDDGGAVS